MINELYSLAQTLSDAKIPLESDHYLRRLLPSGDCFRIWLDDDGSVFDVELLSPEHAKTLCKFGDNMSALPAFNIAPLYRVSSDEDKKLFENIKLGKAALDIEKLKSLCRFDNWGKKRLRQINACLHKQFYAAFGRGSFSALLDICGTINADSFRAELERLVWDKLRGQEDLSTCLSLLIHKGNPQKDDKAEDDSGSLSIILDVRNWETHGEPVSSIATLTKINTSLLEADRNDVASLLASDDYDAFGEEYSDVDKTMPSVRIRAGFDVALRAMFHEQRCQFRYRRADDSSYPITPANRMRAQTALKWLASPRHADTMWKSIDNDAILLVYPDRLPEIAPKFAGLFAADSKATAAKFEEIAREFIKTLKGIPPDERPKNIQVFALRQIPPALSKRAKVDLSECLTVDALMESAEDWHRGFANIPSLYFENADTLFPLEVYKIVNQVWKTDGETKKNVPHMRYFQGVEMLLNITQQSEFLYHLRALLSNCAGLVMFAGNELPRGQNGKLKAAHKVALGKLFPLLGMLLLKLNYKKEEYMESSAFLLGQILKISDGLHALYCKEKRDGDIPPQLVGNAVFVTASENPGQALALLGTRMCPYIAWAKQSGNKLAWWHLGRYEDAMTQISPKITDGVKYSDIDKAQLFIGYLAKLPGNKDAAAPIDDTTTNNKEEQKSE